MQKIIRILAIAAVVQLALIGMMYMGDRGLATTARGALLLDFQTADVDHIVIADHKVSLKLSKQDGWHTASDFPADQQRIANLLQQLHGLKHGLAVATSASAQTRFKVNEKTFERHVVLRHGDKTVAEFYLGSGAGARQSYVRNAQDQTVFRVTLGSYILPLKENDWRDKTLLQIKPDAVSALTVRGVTLTRSKKTIDGKNSVWLSTQTPTEKAVDAVVVDKALKLLQSLRFNDVLDDAHAKQKQAPAGYDLKHPALTLGVRYQGKKRQFIFAEMQSDKKAGKKGKLSVHYLVKVSDRPEYFSVSEYMVKSWLKQFDPDSWFVTAASGSDKVKNSASNKSNEATSSRAPKEQLSPK